MVFTKCLSDGQLVYVSFMHSVCGFVHEELSCTARSLMNIGDLVVGRIRGCLGIIIQDALKPGHVWVYWCTGGLRDKKHLESKNMLYLFNGGRNGTHLLDWR